MLKLHDFELSADCYKARLLMGLLNLIYERIPVDMHPGREHATEALRRIDLWGRLPVLDDAGFRVGGSLPVLGYLARRYGAHTRWLPANARLRARIDEWLLASEELARSAGTARSQLRFDSGADLVDAQERARLWLEVAEEHLSDGEVVGREFLAGDLPTLADIACFPDAALAHEGGVPTNRYPALRRWQRRVQALPGFVAMPGIELPDADPPP